MSTTAVEEAYRKWNQDGGNAPDAWRMAFEAGWNLRTEQEKHHGLDTENQVFFYEQEFYVLSNFSAFAVDYKGIVFPTVEHAYHWSRFDVCGGAGAQSVVRMARSAHDAYTFAQGRKELQRPNWNNEKVDVMMRILVLKIHQHEYVRRKLLETGMRTLIENSWRDSFWGWGPDKKGQNMLGRLWMGLREKLAVGAL